MSFDTAVKSGPGSTELLRSPSPLVKADALLFAHFERPDLKKAEAYLLDFGLIPAGRTGNDLFLRGAGPNPYIYRATSGPKARFLGIGLSVPKAGDLETLSRKFGVPIERAQGPGDGSVVHLRDPDGNAVDALHGFTPAAPLPLRAPIPHNAPNQIVRVNDTQRPKVEPPQVTKLGHLVLETPNFDTSARWYMDTFGMIPSDVMCLPDGTPVGSFMRLDRGAEPSDHHTIFIAMGLEPKVDHVAFEVIDLDAVEMGQQVMMARRHRHAWGVGRHLLGSQIFDYWRDPWGQKHEHYADGDLFDASQPPGYHVMNREGLYQWGPDLPDDYRCTDDARTPLAGAQIGAERSGARGTDDGDQKRARRARPSMAALRTESFNNLNHDGGCSMPIRDLADIQAIEAEPLSARRLPRSTYDAIAATAKRVPDKKALSFFLSADAFDRTFTWTYAELLADITRAANAFHKWGVDEEHPAAFVLPNLPETHFAIWGGEAAGVVLAINPMFEAGQIAELLRTARVRVLVTLGPVPGMQLWEKLVPHLATLPDLKVAALVDPLVYSGRTGAAPSTPASALVPGIEIADFRLAMEAQAADRLIAPRIISENSKSSYFCTGGTTGAPKIAVRTHGNEVYDAWAVALFTETGDPRTLFCGLPLFHVNAQLVTGLAPWMVGNHVVLATPAGFRDKHVIARFWEIVSHYRVSRFSGVPAIFSALLDVPIGGNDISSLDFAICGAAPMPAKLIEVFEAKTGLRIAEGYGLTEGTCVSSVNPPYGERRAGSIGMRLPYQQMHTVILDETGRFLRTAATAEPGTLAIKGPNVFQGYLDPRHNKDLWIEIDGEKWLNTGDLGRQDKDGYFWLSGRRKELIIRGGHNIDPKLIEEALAKHPAVAMTAAIGSPDAYAGEVPVAYVQTKPGSAVTEQELLDFAATHVPERAAVPKRVTIASELPLTSVGKIFKPALHQQEIERVIRSEAEAAGVAVASVVFARDLQLGLLARIRTNGGAKALQGALERYPFKFEVLE